MPNYPATVAEVIRPQRKYKPEVLAALREFRSSKPWRGTVAERKLKFGALHAALTRIYGRPVRLEFSVGEIETERGNGYCTADRRTIVLTGKLSVVTYLHEFSHAIFGPDERQACDWSINLYRRIFPRSAARMITDGHLIDRPSITNLQPITE